MFRVCIEDFNITNYVKFAKKVSDESRRGNVRQAPKAMLQMASDRVPNWSNVLDWMRKHHSGKVRVAMTAPSRTQSQSMEDCTLGVMFFLVRSSMERSWSEILPVLKVYRGQ